MHTHDGFKMIHAYYSQFIYITENVLKHEIHKYPTFSVQGNIKKVWVPSGKKILEISLPGLWHQTCLIFSNSFYI